MIYGMVQKRQNHVFVVTESNTEYFQTYFAGTPSSKFVIVSTINYHTTHQMLCFTGL